MKKLVLTALAALMLVGCGTATAPSSPETPTQSGSARRVLAVSGTALWGINFFQKVVHSWGSTRVRGVTGTGRLSWDYFPFDVTDRQINPVYSGKGELERLSEERFAFSVPEGEALVINQLSGVGVIYLNGYAIALSGGSMPVHYVFGAGELLVVRFVPGLAATHHRNFDHSTTETKQYHDMGVSGYLGDPALTGGSKAAK